jgi:hypothetical protein
MMIARARRKSLCAIVLAILGASWGGVGLAQTPAGTDGTTGTALATHRAASCRRTSSCPSPPDR